MALFVSVWYTSIEWKDVVAHHAVDEIPRVYKHPPKNKKSSVESDRVEPRRNKQSMHRYIHFLSRIINLLTAWRSEKKLSNSQLVDRIVPM
jgi:hypothetical protein